jgi:HSP20 family protein
MSDKLVTFKDLFSIQERVNKLFEDVMGEGGVKETESSVSWSPRVDIYETEEGYAVNAELPGVCQDDLDIKVEGNSLSIKGYRPLHNRTFHEEVDKYHRIECCYGYFRRTFVLPRSVDSSRITAALKDGVLTVDLPKMIETAPRKIEIE